MGLNPSALESYEDINIIGIEFTFSNEVPPNGYSYKSAEQDEAIITYNKDNGHMFATMKKIDGTSYSLEKCSNFHVWKEFDVNTFQEDRAIEIAIPTRNVVKTAPDNSTIVTYTVMFYYTADFASVTSDIPGFIDQVVAETNQGYINSQIPVRIARYKLTISIGHLSINFNTF